MGAGKTTIGRRLAKALGRDFFDSDHEIEEHTGVDIPFIFEKEGEAGFRKRETQTIVELAAQKNIVLATGGGAVTIAENRKTLASQGYVVYLHTSVEQQFERTSKSNHRPLLQNDDPLQKLRDLFAVRDPLYREIADLIVETDKGNAAVICKQIITHWHN